MKRLYVVRHAKASWSNNVFPDYNRPLESQGKSDIKKLSLYLKSKNYTPEYILTSAAKRTLETSNIISSVLFDNIIPPLKKDPLIYEASEKAFLKIISSIDSKYNSLMIVGHNPTITSLINKVSDAFIDHVPTSGIAVIDFEQLNWINLNSGKLIEFIYPKN
jgi:phosphohistidine phosphatase